MKKSFVIISIVIIIIVAVAIYIKINHNIKFKALSTFDVEGEEAYYDILFTKEELEDFEKGYEVEIDLPKNFNFEKEAILVCSGHKLIKAYYNISDEDEKFKFTHFIYVVFNSQKEEKIYLYVISNRYRSWFFSQRYSDGFNGIIYK